MAEQILTAMFEAFNRHDAAAVVKLMTEDCIFETAAGPEIYGTRHIGKPAIQAAFELVWKSMPDVRWDNVRHYAGDERVITEWIFRATRTDGMRIEVDGCDIFTIRDGKVAVKQAFRKDRPPLPAL